VSAPGPCSWVFQAMGHGVKLRNPFAATGRVISPAGGPGWPHFGAWHAQHTQASNGSGSMLRGAYTKGCVSALRFAVPPPMSCCIFTVRHWSRRSEGHTPEQDARWCGSYGSDDTRFNHGFNGKLVPAAQPYLLVCALVVMSGVITWYSVFCCFGSWQPGSFAGRVTWYYQVVPAAQLLTAVGPVPMLGISSSSFVWPGRQHGLLKHLAMCALSKVL
jgi:hypothetical protein